MEALITVRGMLRSSPLPSGKIRLVGGLEVSLDTTTIITLDFDAEKSLEFRPGLEPHLVPPVRMLVRNAGQPLSEATAVASVGLDEESASAGTPGPSPSADGPGAANVVGVVIPTNNNLQFMSFWTAVGAGYFKGEGLDVRTVFPPIPDQSGGILLQGMAEVAVLPPPMFLPLIEQGEPVLIFANLIENDAINLIVRKEFAEENNLSTEIPLVDRLEAIRGLKVGVAPGPPTRLRILFESVGLNADSDIEMVIIHGGEHNDAFGDGSIDALYAHTPYLERALEQQGAVILVNQSVGEVTELSGRLGHALVTTQEYRMNYRDQMLALTRAVHRAQQLIRTDVAATVEALLVSGVPGLERPLLEIIVGIYSPAVPESPEVSVEGVQRAAELFPAHRTQPDLTGIDLEGFIALGISQGVLTP